MFTTLRLALLLSGVTLVISGDATPSKEQLELIEKCKKSNDFNENLPDLKLDDSTPKNAKCFMACLLTEQKIMDKDGKIDLEAGKTALKKMFDAKPEESEKFIGVFEKCAKEGKTLDDKCETAFEHFKCKVNLLQKEGKN